MTINLMITDDHPMIIAGLTKTLLHHGHIQIMGAYTNGAALMDGLARQQPDVLLLDVQLPDIPGNQLARTIHKSYPHIAILALTCLDTSFHALDMLQSGCKGYLLKHTDESTLMQAIEQVYYGERYIDSSMKDILLNNLVATHNVNAKAPNLTVREKEILQLIISGKTCAQIAETLFISVRTAENHRFSIMQKLDVKNTASLVNIAFKLGLTN